MPFKCDIQSLNILSAFPQYKEGCISNNSLEEAINTYFLWDFFDGTSQGYKGGARGILYLPPPLTTSLLSLDWVVMEIIFVNL